jgi:hypothetical protein
MKSFMGKNSIIKIIIFTKIKKNMDTETYIIYGMLFGFLSLWLLFSLARKLGNSSRFPKKKEEGPKINK